MLLSWLPKETFFFLVDVKTVGRYPVRIFRNTVPNLTLHSSTLSFTVIMACQCRLKIALCHRFDALLDSRVDRDCMNEQYLLRNKCGMFHKWKKITSASRHRPNPLEHILSQSKFNAGLAWAEWMIEGYSFSYWNTAHVGTSSGDEDNNTNIRCCVCRHVEQSVQNKLLWGRHYYLWIWKKFT